MIIKVFNINFRSFSKKIFILEAITKNIYIKNKVILDHSCLKLDL